MNIHNKLHTARDINTITSYMMPTEGQLEALEEASAKKQLLTTLEASILCGYTQDHLSLLLRRGMLVGQKRGRDWFIDPASLYNYVKDDPKPGRKPR